MSNGISSIEPNNSDNKERILLLSSRPFEYSGMTKIELDIIDNLSNNIDFDIASYDYCPEYDDLLKSKKIKQYNLSDKKHVLSYMHDIYKTVKNENYKKVYIHGNSSLMLLEALPCKLAGVKVITHCHNGKPQKNLYRNNILKPFFNCLVDCKIACSENAADWTYTGERTVIPNGIDIERFRFNQSARDKIRCELGINEKSVIGHVGTFNEQKNHKKLISIFEEFLKIKSDSILLLIGDGELKEDIVSEVREKGLSEHVFFTGYVNNPEDYFQTMDVLIVPSLFEGFCLVALEAQVSGLPVLVSEKIPEEAIVTENCVKMNLEDSDEAWAKKAFELLNTDRKDNSKSLYEKGYSTDRMIKSIEKELLR